MIDGKTPAQDKTPSQDKTPAQDKTPSQDKTPAQDLPEGFDPAAEPSCDWPPQAEIAHNIAQAKALREQAAAGGLRFEAYLAPAHALWFLDMIEKHKFADPGEALFVLLGEQQDLEPHADLRKEILKRSLDAALNDPRPSIPMEDVFEELRKRMSKPLPEPAVWRKWPGESASAEIGKIEINGMKLGDFRIGMEFMTAAGRWRVSDIGARTVIAIKLDQEDQRNYNGPPYSIAENVFDENDFGGCTRVI